MAATDGQPRGFVTTPMSGKPIQQNPHTDTQYSQLTAQNLQSVTTYHQPSAPDLQPATQSSHPHSTQLPFSAGNKNTYPKTAVMIMGCAQIVLGALSLVMNVALLALHIDFGTCGHGIWSGIFFIIAGILTVGTSFYGNKVLVLASTVLCIIAACLSAVAFSFATLYAISVQDLDYQRFDGHYFIKSGDPGAALHSLIAVFAFVGGFIALLTSAFYCRSECYAGPNSSPEIRDHITVQGRESNPALVLNANNPEGTSDQENQAWPKTRVQQEISSSNSQPTNSYIFQGEPPPKYTPQLILTHL